MKSNAVLGRFIIFMLLMGLPKNRAVASGNRIHPQSATADLLPLTQFLKTALDRAQVNSFSRTAYVLTRHSRIEHKLADKPDIISRPLTQPREPPNSGKETPSFISEGPIVYGPSGNDAKLTHSERRQCSRNLGLLFAIVDFCFWYTPI
jgi:hypothetical protein